MASIGLARVNVKPTAMTPLTAIRTRGRDLCLYLGSPSDCLASI